jgi:tetratricopeptide (TPR) repeat protein
MIIAPIILYNTLYDSVKSVSYAMLPASQLEKFVSAIVQVAIIVPVLTIIVFLLSIFVIHYIVGTEIQMVDPVSRYGRILFRCIQFQSFIFLGAFWFKRKKVIKIIPPVTLNYVIVNAIYMMALIYISKNEYGLAFGWLRKNIQFAEQNNMHTIPTYPKMLTTISEIYLTKNDLKKANYYCNKANNIVQGQSFPNDTKMAVKCCQAQIYIKENENVKAKNCYKECLQFIDTITDREYLIGFYKDYSNLLTQMENYKETVKYLNIYLELQKEEQQEILQLNIKYLQDELDAVRGE